MMKTSKILPVLLLFGLLSYGQEKKPEIKVETLKMGIVIPTAKGQPLARLYKHKNSRIKQALLFMTKKDKPKLI